MFKVNHKNTRRRSDVSIVNFEHIPHLFLSVSIVDFEQVNLAELMLSFKSIPSNISHFPRRIGDVFKTCLQDVFFRMSSRRLKQVFTKTNVCWVKFEFLNF